MQILIHTDHTITGNESRTAQISGILESALNRFRDHITRVEVHVSDENSRKGGSEDIRCVVEARLEGRKPVAVTQKSRALEKAVEGAADKLARMIQHALDRMGDQRRRR